MIYSLPPRRKNLSDKSPQVSFQSPHPAISHLTLNNARKALHTMNACLKEAYTNKRRSKKYMKSMYEAANVVKEFYCVKSTISQHCICPFVDPLVCCAPDSY